MRHLGRRLKREGLICHYREVMMQMRRLSGLDQPFAQSRDSATTEQSTQNLPNRLSSTASPKTVPRYHGSADSSSPTYQTLRQEPVLRLSRRLWRSACSTTRTTQLRLGRHTSVLKCCHNQLLSIEALSSIVERLWRRISTAGKASCRRGVESGETGSSSNISSRVLSCSQNWFVHCYEPQSSGKR